MTTSFTVDNLFCKDVSANDAVAPLFIGSNPTTSGDVVIGQKNSQTKIIGALTINSGSTSSSFTFPDSTGTVHQVLETDGAGNTSWATLSSLNIFDQDLNTTANVQFAELDIGGLYSLPLAAGTAGQVLQSTGGTTTAFGPLLDYGLITQPLSQFASTTSAELATIISDGTGTGSLVFADSPALTTPTVAGNLDCSSVDPASGFLSLGTTNATRVLLSRANQETFIQGPMTVDGQIDVPSSGSAPITIGTTYAGSVTIGRGTQTTTIQGTLDVNNAYTLPVATGVVGQVLQLIGSNSTAAFGSLTLDQITPFTSASLASQVTDETGTGVLVFATSPTLVAPNIGAALATSVDGSSSALNVGTAASTAAVFIGSGSIDTTMPGTLNVNTRINAPSIDAAGMMSIGATDATGITIGSAAAVVGGINIGASSVSTQILGTLVVSGVYPLPVAAGLVGQVMTAQAGNTTAWRNPGGFTQTFGGIASLNEFFPVNGLVTTPAANSSSPTTLGNHFMVPVACTLTRITYDLSTVYAASMLQFFINGSSVGIPPVSASGTNLLILPVIPQFVLNAGDQVAIQQYTLTDPANPRNGLITCYFQ